MERESLATEQSRLINRTLSMESSDKEKARRRKTTFADQQIEPRAEFQRDLKLLESLPADCRSYPIEDETRPVVATAPLQGWRDFAVVTKKLEAVTSRVHRELPEPEQTEIIHGSGAYVSCPDIRSTTYHLDEWDSEADRAAWYDEFRRETRSEVMQMAHSALALDASNIQYQHLLDPQLMERGDEIDAHQHLRAAATSVLSSLDHLAPAREGGRSEPGPGHQLHTELRTAAADVLEKLQDKPPPAEEPPFVPPHEAGKNSSSPRMFMKDDDGGSAYHEAHHNVRNVAAEVIANLNIMVTEPKMEQEIKLRMKASSGDNLPVPPWVSTVPPVRVSAATGADKDATMRKSAHRSLKPQGSVSKEQRSTAIRVSRGVGGLEAGPAAQQVGGGRSLRGSKMSRNRARSGRLGPGAYMLGGGEGEHAPMSDVEEGNEAEAVDQALMDEVDELAQESEQSNHLWPDGVDKDNFGDTFLQSALMQMSAVYKVAKADISKRAADQRTHRTAADSLRSEANVLRNRADDYWSQIQECRRQLKAMYPAIRLDYSESGPPKVGPPKVDSQLLPASNLSSLGLGDSGAPRMPPTAPSTAPRGAKGIASLARPSAVASFSLQQLGGGGSRRDSASTLGETPTATPVKKKTSVARHHTQHGKVIATLTSGAIFKKNKVDAPPSSVGPPVRQKGNDDIERLLPYEEEFPLRAPSEGSAMSTQPSWSSLASWRTPPNSAPKKQQCRAHEDMPLAPPEPQGVAPDRMLRDSSLDSLASSGAQSEMSRPTTPPLAPEERVLEDRTPLRLAKDPLSVIEEMVKCVNAVGNRRSHCTYEAHQVTAPDAGLTSAISSLLAKTDLIVVENEKKSLDLPEFDL